jgi:hypothetical protein
MAYSLFSGIGQTLIYPSTNQHFPFEDIHRDFLIKFHAAYVSYFFYCRSISFEKNPSEFTKNGCDRHC